MYYNPKILLDYLPVAVFLCIATLVALAVIILPKILAEQNPQKNKLKAYECGFDPFDDARSRFDIRFYLVAILFIIFDLEVSFLFPWCVVISNLPLFAFWSMVVFLFILTIGFVYEWKKGALEWE